MRYNISKGGIILVIGDWFSFHLVRYNTFFQDYWHMDVRFFRWFKVEDLNEQPTWKWKLLNKLMVWGEARKTGSRK